MHLIRIDVLQVLSGINASVFVNQPAARLAFKETVVRIVGYIAPTDVTILRVLRVEIAPEQAQTQGQEQEQGQAQMQAEGQGQVQVQEQGQEQEQTQDQGCRHLQPDVVSSPYPYPPLPREP